MTRQELYNKIKKDALSMAEEELRNSRYYEITWVGPETRRSDAKVLNPDWHPYYMRIVKSRQGVKITMAVRDGEIAYFRNKKLAIPDFRTPAVKALRSAIRKHHAELVAIELIDTLNKTEGITATWQQQT